MNTIDPTPLSASGGHDDDDATRPTDTGPAGSGWDTAQGPGGPAGSGGDTAQGPGGPAGSTPPRPEQPLYEPLPYGTGFSSPQPLGFGVGPVELGGAAAGSTGSAVEVADRKRAGSPVLAVAGLLSMAVAVWAILGGPVITPTVLLAGGLVLTVVVGLLMVIRR